MGNYKIKKEYVLLRLNGDKIIHCIGVTIWLKVIIISYKLVRSDYIFTIEDGIYYNKLQIS